MENESNLELEPVTTEETGEEAPIVEKKELTPEQELGIKKRQFTRLAKELGVELPKKEEKPRVESKPADKNGFNDTEKLWLRVEGVSKEDHDYILDGVKATGKSLEQLLESDWVRKELKERQESRRSEQALPEAKNRSGVPPSNSAEYWTAKLDSGQAKIKDVPDAKLRKEIIEARIAKDRERKGIR